MAYNNTDTNHKLATFGESLPVLAVSYTIIFSFHRIQWSIVD